MHDHTCMTYMHHDALGKVALWRERVRLHTSISVDFCLHILKLSKSFLILSIAGRLSKRARPNRSIGSANLALLLTSRSLLNEQKRRAATMENFHQRCLKEKNWHTGRLRWAWPQNPLSVTLRQSDSISSLASNPKIFYRNEKFRSRRDFSTVSDIFKKFTSVI